MLGHLCKNFRKNHLEFLPYFGYLVMRYNKLIFFFKHESDVGTRAGQKKGKITRVGTETSWLVVSQHKINLFRDTHFSSILEQWVVRLSEIRRVPFNRKISSMSVVISVSVKSTFYSSDGRSEGWGGKHDLECTFYDSTFGTPIICS